VEANRYRVVRVIKTGGVSEILEAFVMGHLGFERRVALKRLRPEAIESDSDVHGFVDEARIISQLHHANIVSVFDFGYIDGLPFQALELVEGVDAQTLRSTITALGLGMPTEIALYIALQVGHALAHAHEARDAKGEPLRIVHRDVNPSNILISREGDIKLADFGIALASERLEKTRAGITKGSPAFMAPEQANLGLADKSADIFSLGCVLNYLMVGESPLEREDARKAVLAGADPKIDPDLPENVRAIIVRATKNDKSARYHSAEEFAKEAGEALANRIKGDPRARMKEWLKNFGEAEKLEPPTSDEVAPTPVEHDPLEGSTIHGYRIEGLIGRGSMAKVYSARHLALDLECAFKVLFGKAAVDPRCGARLRREARVLSRLRHPNLVEIRDCGTTPDGAPFLVMELLEGLTLQQLLKREPKLSNARTASIARSIASGLAAAHEHGLVHRDLKPANIMIMTEGGEERVKILDFGLALAIDVDETGTRVTATNALLGTPRYIAPEQIQGASDVGPPADLYALGGIMYAMLTGAPPFSGKMPELIAAQLREAPAPLAECGGLELIVHQLLEKDPSARPSSAREVVERIDALELGKPDLSAVTFVPPRPSGRLPTRSDTVRELERGATTRDRPPTQVVTDPAFSLRPRIAIRDDTVAKVIESADTTKPPARIVIRTSNSASLFGLMMAIIFILTALIIATSSSTKPRELEQASDEVQIMDSPTPISPAAIARPIGEEEKALPRALEESEAGAEVKARSLPRTPRKAPLRIEPKPEVRSEEPAERTPEIDEAILKQKMATLGEALERGARDIPQAQYGALEDRYLDLQKDVVSLQRGFDEARGRALLRKMSALDRDINQARRR
jgi:serine/threonine protein kinase